ncbi:MAG: TetR/AcrR family transcriptional regulator [Verrucomicrobiota bacterium]
MAIADRKKREFLAREELVVKTADSLITVHGYLGLNLDELAEAVEYSKATLYHHFRSKEDLVLAVVNHHLQIRRDYFTRARNFQSISRERILAFGVGDRILSRDYEHSFPLVQLVRSPSIWSKTSETRQNEFFKTSGECFQLCVDVVQDALKAGDLAMESDQAARIVWGLVSLSKGAHLVSEESTFGPENSSQPLHHLFDNYSLYLDGAGWKPLSSDHDYESARERIANELFDTSFSPQMVAEPV